MFKKRLQGQWLQWYIWHYILSTSPGVLRVSDLRYCVLRGGETSDLVVMLAFPVYRGCWPQCMQFFKFSLWLLSSTSFSPLFSVHVYKLYLMPYLNKGIKQQLILRWLALLQSRISKKRSEWNNSILTHQPRKRVDLKDMTGDHSALLCLSDILLFG